MDNSSQESSVNEDNLYPSYHIRLPDWFRQKNRHEQLSKIKGSPLSAQQVGNYLRAGKIVNLKGPQKGVYSSAYYKSECYDCVKRILNDVFSSGIPLRVFGLDKYQQDYQQKIQQQRRMGILKSIVQKTGLKPEQRSSSQVYDNSHLNLQSLIKGKFSVPAPQLPKLKQFAKKRNKSMRQLIRKKTLSPKKGRIGKHRRFKSDGFVKQIIDINSPLNIL